ITTLGRRPGGRHEDGTRSRVTVGDDNGRERWHVGIVADLWWSVRGGAGGQRDGREQKHRDRGGGFTESRKVGFVDRWTGHCPNSFDQLMALTKTPSGLRRSRSASRGCWMTIVRMAVQRSVLASCPFSYRRSVQAT